MALEQECFQRANSIQRHDCTYLQLGQILTQVLLFFFFVITLGLEMSDTKVYEP